MELEKGKQVLVKINDLETSNRLCGTSDQMKRMRGKIYKVSDVGDKIVLINNWWFAQEDVTTDLHKNPQKPIEPVLFDPENLVV